MEETFMADAGSSVSADSAPVDTGASTDANAAWDAAFSRANAATEAEPTDDVAADPEPEPEPVEETPEVADGAEGQAQPEEEPLDPADETTPDGESRDGKSFLVRKQKWTKMLAARDTLDRITSAVPNATPESIQGYYDQAVTFDQMVADFDSGEPERVSAFTNYWLSNEAPQAARETFASQVLERLPQAAPQVYQQFHRRSEQNLVHSMYQLALQRGDEDLLKAAQHFDYVKRGRFLEKEHLQQQQRDPLAEERQRFEQERQQFQNEQRQAAQRELQARTQQLDQTVKDLRNSEIEKALDPVKAQFKDKPQWRHMLRDLTEKVEESINANPAWQRQFALARERAIKDPSGQAAEALSTMVRNFVQPIVANNRKAVIGAATGTVITAANEAHKVAQKQAARREPAATGAPVQRGVLDARMQEAVKKGDAEAAWAITSERARLAATRR